MLLSVSVPCTETFVADMSVYRHSSCLVYADRYHLMSRVLGHYIYIALKNI